MTGEVRADILTPMQEIGIAVRRRTARIAYNVTVAQPAIETGIRIESVQLCNEPDAAPLYDDAEHKPEDAGYHATEERPAEAGGTTATGTFYMLPNRQGTVPHITSQEQKNRANAPENAAYLRIRGTKADTALEYLVYLGANNTTDFNVSTNEAHTYDVTIWSDTRTDTRITRYLLECEDRWPEGRYRSVTDKGMLAYAIENTTDHELVGRLTVVQGEAAALTVMAGGAGYRVPYEFAGERSGQMELTYAPVLIREGKNSRLEYRVELTDETGRSVHRTYVHKFANRVEIFAPEGTGIEAVKVTGALDESRAAGKAVAWCYEGGLELETTDNRFDGWYADAEYTYLLSAEKTFRYVPTRTESSVYAKSKLPETKIICHETAKNSTYMNNVNTVTLTVGDYTGPIIVKAVCERGGVFTAGAEQTVQAEAGKPITLPGNIVFDPMQTGQVRYTIEAYLPDGTKIGETTVTNTIAATRLTPNIRLYYMNPVYQGRYYFHAGGNVFPLTNWYGYAQVCADVSFTPRLDYPEPLKNRRMIEVTLYPKATRTMIVVLAYQGGNGWVLTEEELSYESQPTWSEFTVEYPDDSAVVHTEILAEVDPSGTGELFAPHSEHTDHLLYPGPWEPDDKPEFMSDFTMLDRDFTYFSFGEKIEPSDVKIEKLYFDADLEVVTNFDEIKIIDELDEYWQE